MTKIGRYIPDLVYHHRVLHSKNVILLALLQIYLFVNVY